MVITLFRVLRTLLIGTYLEVQGTYNPNHYCTYKPQKLGLEVPMTLQV